MPKIIGPLFSMGASGTVASVLTYRRGANGATAQRKPIPTGPPTAAQREERATVAQAAFAWRHLDATIKTQWRTLGTKRNANPWLIFCNEWKAQRTTPPDLPLIPG